jgi:transcriptional regulator NrdR family protein
MKCPQCGTWTEVLATRTRPDGSRLRRYQCANLHRFSTVERIEKMKVGGLRHGANRGSRGRFCTFTEKDAASSTLPRVDPHTPRPKTLEMP